MFLFSFIATRSFSQQVTWALSAGGSSIDISTTVAKDNAGNVYIAGKFSGANVDFDPSPGVFLLSSAGGTDGFVAKYNATGQFQWAFRFGGNSLDEVHGIAIDQNDNFFITGYFRGTNIDFDPGPGAANVSSNGDAGVDPGYGGDIFIAKYNAAGVYQWAFNIGGTDLYDAGIGISTDAAGNVYAGGYFTHTADFDPSPGIAILNSAVSGSIFLAKYSNNGAYQWAFGLGSPVTNNALHDIKTDALGNVYITGYYQGNNIDFDPGTGVAPLDANGGYEIFVAKYNTNGQYQLAFSVGGPGWDVARGIGLDNAGNIYIIGDFNNTVDFDPGPGTAFLTSNGQNDAVLAKYSPAGQYLWAFGFGGTPNEYGSKVIIDNAHVFITGSFSGTADLDPSAGVENLTSAGGYDIYLGKYTLDGEYLCSFGVGGPGDDGGHALVSTAPNVFCLTGFFSGTNIDFDPGAATLNLSSAGAEDIFLAKYTWPDNVPPTGTLAGDVICSGEQAQLTFTATAGTGPFIITYNNGTTDIVQTNVQSGVPFNITPNPTVTTTYTLVGIRDALRCSETNFVSGSAVVTVNSCACDNWLSTPSNGSKVLVGDLDIIGNQLTIEAVFTRTQPLNSGLYYGNLVSKHTDQTNVNYSLLPNGCEITTDVSGYMATFQTCVLDLNRTYHVAMVYNGFSLKYYRDGFLMSQIPCTGNIVNNNLLTSIGQIAGGGDPTNNQFLGNINEVRIWNSARTQAEIRTFMGVSLPNPATQPGLAAYYVFNDLINKQGNPAWNGTLAGAASINQTNPNCNFTPDSCSINPPPVVTANFTIPDTVCVNTPVNITNSSTNATSFYWNFCQGNINQVPVGTNLGNPGGSLAMPVFMDYVFSNNNYYGFLVNYASGNLTRLNFGTSLLNAPTATNLGNFGGTIPPLAEGIQVVQNEGNWYAIIVAGYAAGGSPPGIIKVDFGINITNNTPVATNWGNLGNLSQPVDLHVFQENGQWYGFTVNAENNTITRFDFTNSFNNVPTAINLGNIGNLSYPTGIYAINDNNNWRVFIVNAGNNSRINGTFSLTRLDFGTSLLNVPTGVNLGNPGNILKHPRDLTIMKFCGQIIGFAVNGLISSDDIIKMDFNNDLTSTPVMSSLGNIGNLAFPHSLAKIFRVGSDLYSFITNVENNTITRLRFAGCSNSSIQNSNLQTPPAIIYDVPGTYSIHLTVDDGLPTQTTFCKQVVVLPGLTHRPMQNVSICQGDSIQVGASPSTGTNLWNTGATTDSLFLNSSGLYWIETSNYGCINRDTFLVALNPAPFVQLGDDINICPSDTLQLNAGNTASSYVWNTGSLSQSISVYTAGTYYVTVTNLNSCTASDTVNVSLFPVPVIALSNDTVICKNSSVQLFANGGINYVWSPSAVLNNPNISNPVASPSVNTTYYVTITDANTCNNLDSVKVDIRPDPVFTISPPAPICENDPVQLTAGGGNVYSWQPTSSLSNPAISNPVATPSVNTNYSVVITETNCNATTTLTTTITVLPLPIVKAAKSNDIECSNDRSQLNATGATTYLWSPAGTLSNAGIANPVAAPVSATGYIVRGTDDAGCINYDSVIVNVDNINKGGYLMPNAFTPNGDGLNDCYGIRYWGVIEEVEFSIYNRWGERIFFTKNPNACWDGTYKSTRQDIAVYVYIVKAKTTCESSVFRKGTFALIR